MIDRLVHIVSLSTVHVSSQNASDFNHKYNSCKIANRGFSLKVYLKNSVRLAAYGSKTDSGCIDHS